jgi:hypothetical protein
MENTLSLPRPKGSNVSLSPTLTKEYELPFGKTIVLMGLLSLNFLLWLSFDAEPIAGMHPAIKPLKFSVSVLIYLASLRKLWPWIGGWFRSEKRVLAHTITFLMWTEILIIVTQAGRGVPSHFNTSSSLNGWLFTIMGIAIGLAMLCMVRLTYLAMRNPLKNSVSGIALDNHFTASVRSGLILFVLAAIPGALMSTFLKNTMNVQNTIITLPFLNWNLGAGDLRVSHFLFLHALQVLPLGCYVINKWMKKGRWKNYQSLANQIFLYSYSAICVSSLILAVGQLF